LGMRLAQWMAYRRPGYPRLLEIDDVPAPGEVPLLLSGELHRSNLLGPPVEVVRPGTAANGICCFCDGFLIDHSVQQHIENHAHILLVTPGDDPVELGFVTVAGVDVVVIDHVVARKRLPG